MIPIVIRAFGISHQRISTRTVGLGNKRTSGDYPNYCIDVIGQNTKKSPEDLRKLTVTQDSSGKTSANAGVKKLSNE